MRLTRLDLLRFGKFTDQSVSLPHATQDFHLIVGRNEAGKSTLRNAIQDLLFGIETRSRYNFLHQHNEMRLGGLISQEDATLEFVRTKARSKTLQTAGGTPLPDDALLPYLGQVERSFFDQMFGLNHERLVQGGQEILSASNDIGQILFEAAAGIGSLGAIRDKLEQEAENLWAPRKSEKREYYTAAQELERAEAALKNATVRTKDWQEARSIVDGTAEKLAMAQAHYEQLAQGRLQLERVRRIAPLLTSLLLVESQLAELGTVIELPPNAAEELARAEHELAIAAESRQLHERQVTELNDRIAALNPDVALLARAADIEALSESRLQLRNHERDIAKREGEIRVLWQDIQEAARQLNWPAENETETTQRLPGILLRADMTALLRRHGELLQQLAAADTAHRGRIEEMDAIAAEIALLPAMTVAPELAECLAVLRSLGDIDAQEKRTQAQIARHQGELDFAVLQLGQWHPDAATLRQLQPPTQDEISVLLKRRADLEMAAATRATRMTETQSAIKKLQLEISQYKATYQPVTLTDVIQARSQRDATWQVIKTGDSIRVEATHDYETIVVKADNLSDQRHDKAREETELQSRVDRLASLELQLDELRQGEQDHAAVQSQFDLAWHERMQTLGLPGMSLFQINDWRGARERVLSATAALTQARESHTEFLAAVANAKVALVSALKTVTPTADDMPVSALIRCAEDWISEATRTQDRRSSLTSQKLRAAAAEQELRNRLQQAQAAMDTWAREMQKNLAQAHLPADASIAMVEAACSLFERMHQQLQKIHEIRGTRIDMMQRDLDAFAAMSKALALAIAPALEGQPPQQISEALESQLKLQANAAQELDRLKNDRDKAESYLKNVDTKSAEATACLEPLLRLSGTTTNDALRKAASDSDRWRNFTTERQQALKQLLNAGDGLDRAALAAEFSATGADAASVNLAENKRQTDDVVKQQNLLSAELSTARSRLEKIAGQSEAARAEAQRQEALARMANALERFIKVFTAAKLLRWSIEKFRETKQGPMLLRASEVFMGLTQGAFPKLVVDYESEPVKLFGQRATGELVEIDGMSEGTRDQLYLALRLAALELHLDKSPSLPFIADDLFINYDDGRAKAGLLALARLSEKTQVIFLSHHAHLVRVAREVFGDRLNVVELG